MVSNSDDTGLENAAILLMSLGEEDASQVLKHMTPKEVQRLGETIAKTRTVAKERFDSVVDRFQSAAKDQSMLVADTDEYVKSVLRKALGDDKANLLIDRILQGSDTSGIESLKWMDPSSVAELPRLEPPRENHQLNGARQLAKDNPAAVANIMREWVSGEVTA